MKKIGKPLKGWPGGASLRQGGGAQGHPQPGAESPAHPHQVGLGGAQGRQPPARCQEPCPPSPDQPRRSLPPLPSTPELARSCVLSLWLGSSPRLDHPALLRTSDPVMLLERRGPSQKPGTGPEERCSVTAICPSRCPRPHACPVGQG